MITLRDVIHINAPPEVIFEWFRNLDKNYREWHKDHVKWEFFDGFHEGSRCYCEETLHGELHKMKGKITTLKENRLIEYEFSLPISLICPGGSFSIEPDREGSAFTATLSFRFASVLARFAEKRINSARDHMIEEGENLKRILERAHPNPAEH